MNSNIKKRWITALHSNQYKQTKTKLHTDYGYCCLGVLCDLYAQEHDVKWILRSQGDAYQMEGDTYELPLQVMIWAELDSRNPKIQTEEYGIVSLAEYNDFGIQFEEIANVIEKQL